MVEFWIQGLHYSVSKFILNDMELAGVMGSNIATYGALQVLDIIASICSRVCHHYLGKLLNDGVAHDVGRRGLRGRGGQPGGGRVAETRVQGFAEARGLVDVEAQVRVSDSCVVAMDGVTEPSRDLSGNVVTTECEVV